MSIIIYGSELCPDCRGTKELFDEKKVDYVFKDITKELGNLKEFLAIRDTSACYDSVKQQQGIGIPCIVKEDESVTLDPQDVL